MVSGGYPAVKQLQWEQAHSVSFSTVDGTCDVFMYLVQTGDAKCHGQRRFLQHHTVLLNKYTSCWI